MYKNVKELLPNIFMMLFGLLVIFIIPYQIEQQDSSFFGPRFFPYLASTLVFVFSLGSIIYSIWKGNNGKERSHNSAEWTDKKNYIRVLLIFICLVFWIYFVSVTGFIITTIVFIATTSVIIGGRNPLTVLLVTILFTFIVYYVFTILLKINLPKGMFF